MTMTKYVLTIGTFDKDTKQLKKEPSAWMAVISEYVAQHFDGATVYSTDGVYKHIDGAVVREPSIRVELVGAEKSNVLAFAAFAKQALNQESIMYEEISENVEFI